MRVRVYAYAYAYAGIRLLTIRPRKDFPLPKIGRRPGMLGVLSLQKSVVKQTCFVILRWMRLRLRLRLRRYRRRRRCCCC